MVPPRSFPAVQVSACMQQLAAPALRHAATPPAQAQCRRQRLCSRQLCRTQRREHRFVAVACAISQSAATPTELPQLLPLDENYEVAHTFARYANWLIRGRLILGRYPFVEPSRCVSRSTGERQLSEILDVGIRTFVCLQGELPPQQEIPLSGIRGFQSYAATASLMVKAREPPIPAEETTGLRNRYVDKFLPPRRGSPQQQQPPQQQFAQQPGQQQAAESSAPPELQFVHEPITDLDIPSEERLEALLDDLEARMRRGEAMYLHCWGGRGRAGTVGATLLHRLYGLPAEECLERVQRSYDTRKDPERRLSPETPEQVAFVKSFIKARS